MEKAIPQCIKINAKWRAKQNKRLYEVLIKNMNALYIGFIQVISQC